jgi:hypothetical protein
MLSVGQRTSAVLMKKGESVRACFMNHTISETQCTAGPPQHEPHARTLLNLDVLVHPGMRG